LGPILVDNPRALKLIQEIYKGRCTSYARIIIHVLEPRRITAGTGEQHASREGERGEAHEIGKQQHRLKRKLRRNADNDGTSLVYFLYYVVYSFEYV